MTFTTKPETDTYKATFENDNQTEEPNDFQNYSRNNFDLMDHTDAAALYTYSHLLNGGYSSQVGLAKSLAVVPGDTLKVEVFGKYTNVTAAPSGISGFAAALTSAFELASGGSGEAAMAFDALDAYGALIASGFDHSDDQDAPKAYLNVLLFDKDYNFVDAAYEQIGEDDEQDDPVIKAPHGHLSLEMIVPEAGYAYIFLSNENPTQVDVYFDDLKITHAKSPVVQADDYYPFGLTFNSYQRENATPNRWKFQGQEHVDDLGLNWDSYRYRNHQPDIGRFCNIDPMADAFYYNSPYAFSENKVTTHREMEGLEAFFIHGTRQDNSMWKKDVANFIMRELKPYFSTDQTADLGFKWNDYAGGGVNRNWLGNSGKRGRAVAARQLVSYILKNRKQGQGITLVGHSHGGNVAIQAARILFEKHNTSVNIVNFNTPAWNGANDPENPWDNFGIDEMLHFFTDGDLIAGPLSGKNNYGGLAGSNVKQIELKNPLKTNFWGTQQHYFENVNWQEVLSQFGAMMNHYNSLGGNENRKKKEPDADKKAADRSGGG